MIATLQTHPVQLERVAKGFGWSLSEDGVQVLYRSPVDLYVDQWVHELGQSLSTRHGGWTDAAC